MKRYVLDASMLLSWLLPDEDVGQTIIIRQRFADSEFWAPAHWRVEVANALCMAERRRRIQEKGLLESLQIISELPVIIDDGLNSGAVAAAVSLARNHRLSVYDAGYLELAIRLGAILCSFDKELIAAAAKVQLSLLPLRQLK